MTEKGVTGVGHDCPVHAAGPRRSRSVSQRTNMTSKDETKGRSVIGGVDTLGSACRAVVDHQDRMRRNARSPAARGRATAKCSHGCARLASSSGVGVESTGSYGAGLLRFMQQAGVTVLEVTAPDKAGPAQARQNDDLDAQNAAHAAFAGKRTVTPRSRDGMIEALRVLVTCRKTAVTARRIALQMIRNTIVAALDGLRDQLRVATRMQLVPHARRLAPRPHGLSGRGGGLRMASSLSTGATSSFTGRIRSPRCRGHFGFDAVETEGVIRFVMRAGPRSPPSRPTIWSPPARATCWN